MTDARISFPRQDARTVSFSLGVPHSFAIATDGSRIAFLRARSGTDRSTCLWLRDTASGTDRLIADPGELLSGGEEDLSAEERARRERARQAAAGVVSFAAWPSSWRPRRCTGPGGSGGRPAGSGCWWPGWTRRR